MKPGIEITINCVLYKVELVGPVTTLLVRGDGAFVHASSPGLNAIAEAKGGVA